jgi:glutathione synthase/RimK-type ligase-like ATP-grasp enzyme
VIGWDLEALPRNLELCVADYGVTGPEVESGEELGALYVARGEYMSPVTDWRPTREEWALLQGRLELAVRPRQEARSLRASICRLWSDTLPVVNPARSHRACLLVPSLLRSLAEANLPVVTFVSGNDLEQIAGFVDGHRGACRARRLGQPSYREWAVDLDYLRDHAPDFDEFPLMVRQVTGSIEHHVLVIGGNAVGAVAWDRATERWHQLALPPAAADLGARAAELAGLHLGLVHLEQREGDEWHVVGLEAEPDLERLEDQGGIQATEKLAELLITLAQKPWPEVGRPAAANGHRGSGQLPSPVPAAYASFSPRAPARRRSGPNPSSLRIGITGQSSNAEVALVAQALEARGAVPVLLELPLFPEFRALGEHAEGGRIALDHFADLAAVFLRTTGFTSPVEWAETPGPPGWAERRPIFLEMAENQAECFLFQYAVLETLGRRIPVINPPWAQEVHRTKVHQLFSLMRAGFPVPATLAGNQPEACAQFVAAQGGEGAVVVKPLAGIYKTTRLSEAGGLAACLERGPVILQRYLAGDTLRAYLVGEKLVGAGRIVHAGAAVDASVEQRGVVPVALPDPVIRLGAAAAKHLGLAWTGMDFLREQGTGEYFILECNAAAMFAGFSQMTGIDVAGALADYLLELGSGLG